MGSATSTSPVPVHTRQCAMGESKSKGSFPVPLQNAHFTFAAMIHGINVPVPYFAVLGIG